MEMGIFTWIGSFWMVASQLPMRIGLTQIGLRPLVASYSQLPYSMPFGLARILSSLLLFTLVLLKALRSSSCCWAFLLFASLQ